MPTLPLHHARPLRADQTRLGQKEMERQSMLLAVPGRAGTRFPGDGGNSLVNGAARAEWTMARRGRPVWSREDQ